MARLSLSLLGPFQATLGGAPVTDWPSAKVRALLIYLAVESDHAHRRETLAGLLWPDYPDRSAHTNLSNALSHLRTILHDRDRAGASVLTPRRKEHQEDRADTRGRPYIVVDRETVQFDRTGDCWVDATAFVDLAGRQDASDLEQAVTLYRGPFLEGFSLHDSPPFEQWALVTRERLQRQMMDALARLAALEEERGETERALATTRRQLEIEPWQETAHQAVMRLLAVSGRRADALAQYEVCCRVLKEELSVEPGAETVRLYERIKKGDLAGLQDLRGLVTEGKPGAEASEPGEKPDRPAVQHNLPAQSAPFVGRERELAELDRLLADPQVRLVTVVGPGGCGKTRLALEAATRQVGCYEHGVWFASLAALQSVESIVPAVAGAIGFQLYPGSDPRQQLLDYLREKRMLLVLDNWEHLLEGANFVADLVGVVPRVHVLATSRARLNLQGEQGFPLEGLSYPALALTPGPSPLGRGEYDDTLQYSAVQLFLQSARRVRPDLRLEDDLGPVVRLCRLVDGMPLALVLAAAWVEMLSPAEIAAEIERSLDFLAAEWRDLPERQRSVRAVFDTSWRLLSEREQQVFATLSVFRGGFTREAAEQVAGADLRALVTLMNKSFLQRDARGRYQMHELLRQYGEEKLNGSPDSGQAVWDRHAAYYAAASERWAAELKGPRQQAALVEMDVEIDNARASWEWATAQGQVERLSQGTEGLGWFYDWRVRYEEAETMFRVMADQLAEVDAGWEAASADRQRAVARLWSWQSHFGRPLGHTEQARKLLRRSLDLLDRLENAGRDVRLERAFALWQSGEIERWSGGNSEARSLLEHSLSLYRSVDARWETANVLGDLGTVLQALGFYDQAGQKHREALALHRELENQHGIVGSIRELGWVVYEQGDFVEAEQLLRESLTLARAQGIPFAIDFALALLCHTIAWQGRFAEARSLADEALVVYRGRPDRAMSDRFAADTSTYELHLGRYAQARLAAQTGLVLARKIDFQWQIGAALLHLGRAAMAEGAYAEAGQRIRESLGIYEAQGSWAQVVDTLALLAGVALLQGDLAAARQHLGRALRMVTEHRSFLALLPVLSFGARLLAEQGYAERAVEIYALASRHGYVANSRWYADLVGQLIAEVAATLPPDAVAAAQERGRAHDVWATAEELAAGLG